MVGVRDFNRWQADFFLAVSRFLVGYEPPEFQPLVDDDVAQAAAAMAATLETASRGVIYEHRPESRPAERLLAALRPLLAEARRNGPATFDRDAAVVLRRVAELAGGSGHEDPTNPRWYLAVLGRVISRMKSETSADSDMGEPSPEGTPRLIVP